MHDAHPQLGLVLGLARAAGRDDEVGRGLSDARDEGRGDGVGERRAPRLHAVAPRKAAALLGHVHHLHAGDPPQERHLVVVAAEDGAVAGRLVDHARLHAKELLGAALQGLSEEREERRARRRDLLRARAGEEGGMLPLEGEEARGRGGDDAETLADVGKERAAVEVHVGRRRVGEAAGELADPAARLRRHDHLHAERLEDGDGEPGFPVRVVGVSEASVEVDRLSRARPVEPVEARGIEGELRSQGGRPEVAPDAENRRGEGPGPSRAPRPQEQPPARRSRAVPQGRDPSEERVARPREAGREGPPESRSERRDVYGRRAVDGAHGAPQARLEDLAHFGPPRHVHGNLAGEHGLQKVPAAAAREEVVVARLRRRTEVAARATPVAALRLEGPGLLGQARGDLGPAVRGAEAQAGVDGLGMLGRDDSGVEDLSRVEGQLDFSEEVDEVAVDKGQVRRAETPVTVLARERAAKLRQELGLLLRDAGHLGEVLRVPEVHEGVHVEVAVAGVAEDDGIDAPRVEDLRHAGEVPRDGLEGHGAVLDESDRLEAPAPLVEEGARGLPEGPDGASLRGRRRAAQAHRACRRGRGEEGVHGGLGLFSGLSVALHEQDRVDGVLNGERERPQALANDLEEGVVQDLARRRPQGHEVEDRPPRGGHVAEPQHREALVTGQGQQVDRGAVEHGERALRAHEKRHEIHAPLVLAKARPEVVAGGVGAGPGPALEDAVPVVCDEARGLLERPRRVFAGEPESALEAHLRAVGQKHVQPEHVVHRGAVLHGAGPLGVVGEHAAQGAEILARRVGGEPKAAGGEGAVEVGEHDAGFHHGAPPVRVHLDHPVHPPRDVGHHARPHGLAREATSPTPHGQRDMPLGAPSDGPRQVLQSTRVADAAGLAPVDARGPRVHRPVGGIFGVGSPRWTRSGHGLSRVGTTPSGAPLFRGRPGGARRGWEPGREGPVSPSDGRSPNPLATESER